MERRNQLLTSLLVLQMALVALVYLWPRPGAAGSPSGPLLANFEPGNVAMLTVQDAEANSIALARRDEGWVLPEADEFPADSSKVAAFLDKLALVRTNRLVTQTEESHERLQVAEEAFERLVTLEMADGSTHELRIGTSAGPSATHIRVDEQPEVYLTGDLASWDANAVATGWINPTYYTVPLTATVGLTLSNASGTFEFTREGEAWSLVGLAEGETFNQSALTAMLAQATSMTMVRPLGSDEEAAYGLASPRATVTLRTAEGETHTLLIGAEDAAAGSAVAKWSESPYFVQIASPTAASFVEKRRDDFLQLARPPRRWLRRQERPAPARRVARADGRAIPRQGAIVWQTPFRFVAPSTLRARQRCRAATRSWADGGVGRWRRSC